MMSIPMVEQPSPLTAAMAYAARGWAVFPLHTADADGCCSCNDPTCSRVGKHPRTEHGLHDATTDPDIIRRWWSTWPTANIGIATGARSGFVVVDIDLDKGGEDRIAELLKGRDPLPRTPWARTGGGGRHLLFATPDGGLGNSRSKIAKGIDVRGDGGYIVAPPSAHASGRSYQWGDDAAPLAPLPAWLLERARGAPRLVPPPPAPTPPRSPSDDYAHALRRASAYLAKKDPAISGQGGHDATFDAACDLVRGFRLSRADALYLLEREYNPRCEPPWSRRELEHKVDQAEEKSDRPAGYLLDVAPPAPPPAPGQPGPPPSPATPTPPTDPVAAILEAIRALPDPRACLEDATILERVAALSAGSPPLLRLSRELKATGVSKSALDAALRWHTKQAAEKRAAATADERAPVPSEAWATNLVRTAEGDVASVPANVITILRHDARWAGIIGWDDFRQGIAFRRPPPFDPDDFIEKEDHSAPDVLDDYCTPSLTAWLVRKYGIRLSDEQVYKAARVVSMAPGARFNSVRDYLASLTWDGIDRIGGDYPDSPPSWLARYLGVEDTPYARFVGRAWLISAIARAYKPGVKADHMLVFEGDQGAGKSTALEVLGGDYYSGSPLPLHDKDRFVNMRGVWIQNFDELASLSRSDEDAAKNFLSERQDVYRPPYGRDPVKVPRRCVFAGTLNPKNGIGYLRDETGGRRFWPVRCGAVGPLDYAALGADRDQLWAQARELYIAGEKWWPSTVEERALCEAEQAERQERDVWEDAIYAWLHTPREGRLRAFVTAGEVLEGALRIDTGKQEQKHERRVGAVMKALGWHAVRPQESGDRRRGYERPETALAQKMAEVRRLEESLRRARGELDALRATDGE